MSQSPAPRINLLSKRKASFDKQTQVAVKSKVWSGVVLVGYVAVLVLIVLVGQVFSWRVNSTQKAIDAAKLTLTSKIVMINQYEMIQDRITIIKKLLADKRESIGLWQGVRARLPLEVELTQFTLDGNNLTLGFTAPHVVSANQTIDMIATRLSEIGISKTSVTTSRGDTAEYQLSAEAVLSGSKKE